MYGRSKIIADISENILAIIPEDGGAGLALSETVKQSWHLIVFCVKDPTYCEIPMLSKNGVAVSSSIFYDVKVRR
jgi:hypothetical protein